MTDGLYYSGCDIAGTIAPLRGGATAIFAASLPRRADHL